MRVSDHFNRSEFACKDQCGFKAVDKILVETLEITRTYFTNKYPDRVVYIQITSGNRCEAYNQKVGGSKNSFHTKGMAADFKVNQVDTDEVYEYLDKKYPNWFGIGLYDTWVHLDTRSTPARWKG